MMNWFWYRPGRLDLPNACCFAALEVIDPVNSTGRIMESIHLAIEYMRHNHDGFYMALEYPQHIPLI
jgi:hypothetical protein